MSVKQAMPGGVTLLEASAGTGKTFQISQRVLRLVAEEAIPISRLLVVTFTEAASAELRDRIRKRLRDAREGLEAGEGWQAPDEVLEAWVAAERAPGEGAAQLALLRQALVDFDEAAISTIHGFCNRTLRRFAFECQASFDAELMGTPADLVDQLARDFWTRVRYDADPALAPALEAGGMTLKSLGHLVGKAKDPDLPVIPMVA